MWAREYCRHYSACLKREMEFLVLGHGGAPVLVFPTSRGRFFQWEDFGMIRTLGRHLENGWLQLFCLDGVDNETWYDFQRPQREILDGHLAYDAYVAEEFLPEIGRRNSNSYLMVTGTSFGAYQAANFVFRHPQRVQRLLAMSGDYCIRKYLDDYYDGDVYYNNPVDYLPGLGDPELLEALKRIDMVFAVGQNDFCLEPTLRLSSILNQLGIPHRCPIWGHDAIHDWPTWQAMLLAYL